MASEKSFIGNMFHKNGRALGSMGYFALLMLVFLFSCDQQQITKDIPTEKQKDNRQYFPTCLEFV